MSKLAQALALQVNATPSQMLGMPPAKFLRDYWQKRPLLIRNAFADFSNPVTPDDLAGLACEESALSRIVLRSATVRTKQDSNARRNDSKKPSRDERWTLRTGPFAESDFAKLPKSNWTLLVQDVDKWDADVAALLDRFRFLPSWRIDDVMVSYAEDGGSVGAHVDQYDVFLLQGLGRRRWQIDARAFHEKSAHGRASSCDRLAFREDSELKLLREFTPTDEWLLEPGDMLYLPPGVPHHGIAVGACMTYSIGMRAPSMADLAGDFVDHLIDTLPEGARYADADLTPARGDGEIDDVAIARVTAAMPWLRAPFAAAQTTSPRSASPSPLALRSSSLGCSGDVDSSMLRTWFGCFITRYRSAQTAAPNPRRLGDAAFARALVDDTAQLQRNPWSRVAWMRDGKTALLFVAGECHACSLKLAQLIGTHVSFASTEVPHAVRDHAVVRALIDAGHFRIVRRRR